jgi:hypothetical protein
LISKSNCAFVNYRTEEACDSAVQRFHDSRFQGVRLVCRQRKALNTRSGASSPSSLISQKETRESKPKDSTADEPNDNSDSAESTTGKVAAPTQKLIDRFFIVKSLTLQDLDQSVRNGIWATQTHNEAALNQAYEVSARRNVCEALTYSLYSQRITCT